MVNVSTVAGSGVGLGAGPERPRVTFAPENCTTWSATPSVVQAESDCTSSTLLVLVKRAVRRSLSLLSTPSRPLPKSTNVFAMLATGVMGTSQGDPTTHEGDGTGMCSTVTPEAKGKTCQATLTTPLMPFRSQRMLVLLTSVQRALDEDGVLSSVVAW